MKKIILLLLVLSFSISLSSLTKPKELYLKIVNSIRINMPSDLSCKIESNIINDVIANISGQFIDASKDLMLKFMKPDYFIISSNSEPIQIMINQYLKQLKGLIFFFGIQPPTWEDFSRVSNLKIISEKNINNKPLIIAILYGKKEGSTPITIYVNKKNYRITKVIFTQKDKKAVINYFYSKVNKYLLLNKITANNEALSIFGISKKPGTYSILKITGYRIDSGLTPMDFISY